ncbi:MAG: M28 family peptidase [Rikenellaceae bacterium]|nr:M28 family peptidase [Rikenellaceae bacterium]
MRFIGYVLTACISLGSAAGANAQAVSRQRLEHSIAALGAAGEAGRKAGSPEGEAAAEYIAGAFEAAGLFPYYAGQYIDEFTAGPLVGEARKTYRNVAGIIYGSNYELDGDYIVIGAHYDFSGPTTGSSNTVIEDNISGVATLLELAYAVKECSPGRNVILVAFDGYEAGLLGSRRFVEENTLLPEDIFKMVNLSRVGARPADGTIHIFAEDTAAKELAHFSGSDNGPAITVESAGYGMRSDTEPFTHAGIPTIYITTVPEPANPAVESDTDYTTLQAVTGYVAGSVCSLAGDATIKRNTDSVKRNRKRGPRFEAGVSVLAGTSFFRETDGDTRGKTLFSGGAGVYGQVNFGRYFALRPEVQYIHSGSRLSTGRARMNSAVVPVSLVIQTPPYLAGSLQVLVGGYYRRSFGFSGADWYSGGDEAIPISSAMYRNGAGVHWGLNLRLKRFGIGVTTRYGLTDLYSVGASKNMRERATYGTISYNF